MGNSYFYFIRFPSGSLFCYKYIGRSVVKRVDVVCDLRLACRRPTALSDAANSFPALYLVDPSSHNRSLTVRALFQPTCRTAYFIIMYKQAWNSRVKYFPTKKWVYQVHNCDYTVRLLWYPINISFSCYCNTYMTVLNIVCVHNCGVRIVFRIMFVWRHCVSLEGNYVYYF